MGGPQCSSPAPRTVPKGHAAAPSPHSSGTRARERPLDAARLRRSRGLSHGWQVKDSNLRSFRDGFTVRSHWPLGQPAWCAWKDSKPHPADRIDQEDPWRTAASTSSARTTSRRSPTPSTPPRRRSRTATTSRTSAPASSSPTRSSRWRPAPRSAARPSSTSSQTWLVKRGVSLKHLDVPEAGPAALGQGVQARLPAQGGHLLGEREEDHQDHPRRGAQERQDPDPGRRGARHEQVAATTSRPCSASSRSRTSTSR